MKLLLINQEIFVLITTHGEDDDFRISFETARLAVIPIKSVLETLSDLQRSIDQQFATFPINNVLADSCMLDVPHSTLYMVPQIAFHGIHWILPQPKNTGESIIESVLVTLHTKIHSSALVAAYMIHLQKKHILHVDACKFFTFINDASLTY